MSTWQTDTDSFALFFQGTYDISDSLSLTAGLRYTEEEKDVYTRVDIVQDAALVDGVMVNDLRNLATPDLNPYNAALNAATFDSYQHEFDEDRKTDQLMPALSLEWEMSDTSMFYISYAEGFKSGGFNAVDSQMPAFDAATGAPLSTTPGLGFEYDDETAQSI